MALQKDHVYVNFSIPNLGPVESVIKRSGASKETAPAFECPYLPPLRGGGNLKRHVLLDYARRPLLGCASRKAYLYLLQGIEGKVTADPRPILGDLPQVTLMARSNPLVSVGRGSRSPSIRPP